MARADDATAAELKKSGNEKMVDSNFVGALEDYKKALEAAPGDAALHYNIGRAHGLLGHHPEAMVALETFARTASPEVKARVARFDELLADIRQHVGYLTVSCDVPGARVLNGAQVLGDAPLTHVAVEAGAAELKIEAEGFRDDARRVTFEGQKELTVECRLLPKATSGTLVVTTKPLGATVSIDGKVVGNPPLEVPLHAGPHTVLARRQGYDDASVPVVVVAGDQNRRLEIPLQQSIPITARWWFWTGVGVVVVGGIVLTAALLTEKSPDKGTIQPGQLSAPLVRF